MTGQDTRFGSWFTRPVLAIMIATTQLHAQSGVSSDRLPLKDGKSISLTTTETWDGHSTHVGVDFMLTGPSMPSRTVYSMELFQTPFNLGLQPHDGVYPSFLSVIESESLLAILIGVMPLSTSEDGHYLLLDQAGEDFRALNSLKLTGLLPTSRSVNPQKLRNLELSGLRRIQIIHHDGFGVNIDIAPNNSVTINGKPCSPANAPIKRLDYRQFLNALSPSTEQTYDDPLRNPKAIPWWTDPSMAPPFSFSVYKELSPLIGWSSQPAIDPTTIPASIISNKQPANLAADQSKLPERNSTSKLKKESESTPAQPLSAEPLSSTRWCIIVALVLAAGVLLRFLHMRRQGAPRGDGAQPRKLQ